MDPGFREAQRQIREEKARKAAAEKARKRAQEIESKYPLHNLQSHYYAFFRFALINCILYIFR